MTKSKVSFSVSLVVIGVVVGLVVVAVALFAGGDGKDKSAGGKATSAKAQAIPQFKLSFPKTWKRVSPERGANLAIARTGSSGLVSMKIAGPVKQSLPDLGADLRKTLAARVKGFKLITSERVKTAAGSAWLTSWYVGKSKLVHSNLVVPAGKASFTLDAAVPAGNDKAASELGDIFSAFSAPGQR